MRHLDGITTLMILHDWVRWRTRSESISHGMAFGYQPYSIASFCSIKIAIGISEFRGECIKTRAKRQIMILHYLRYSSTFRTHLGLGTRCGASGAVTCLELTCKVVDSKLLN